PNPIPAWRGPEATKGFVTSIDVSRDGKHLLFAATDGHVRWWDMVAGREALSFKFQDGWAALSPDGTKALTLDGQERFRLWGLGKDKEIAAWPTPGRSGVAPPVFTPDGMHALVAHSVGKIDPPFEVCLWDLKARKVVRTFPHPGGIICLAVAPDGKRFLT